MLAELAAMGFNNFDATDAYQKAKQKDLHTIIDILTEE